ncbi:MAG: hypothetical protein O4859_00300 [Trichodesmium sp. St18_bin1]|nr:hypothetical protein [Trichodesmium sp. St18_bin1]
MKSSFLKNYEKFFCLLGLRFFDIFMNLFITNPNNFSQKLALLKVVGLGLRNPVSTCKPGFFQFALLFCSPAGVPGNQKK